MVSVDQQPRVVDDSEELCTDTNNIHREGRIKKYAKRAGASVLIAANLTTTGLYAYVQDDIYEGKRAVADSHPETHLIYDVYGEAKSQSVTYVATGLGTKDPSESAEKLTAHSEVGSIVALEYSGKDINIDELTEVVVDDARANGKKYISFDGYSAGGSILLAVAAKIHKEYNDVHVISVAMNSSPVGEFGLTEKSKEASKILSYVLQFWPDLAYSEKSRWAAEVIARNDRYYDQETNELDYDGLKNEITVVYDEKIANDKVAKGNLISSQFDFIVRHGVERSLKELGTPREGKFAPSVFYTRSKNPTDDAVTHVEWSSHDVAEMAARHNVPLQVIPIDNIGHANPAERPTEYNATIERYINPIRQSILRVFFSYGGEPITGENIYDQIPPRYSTRIGGVAIDDIPVVVPR